jgi:hypothetical protein
MVQALLSGLCAGKYFLTFQSKFIFAIIFRSAQNRNGEQYTNKYSVSSYSTKFNSTYLPNSESFGKYYLHVTAIHFFVPLMTLSMG